MIASISLGIAILALTYYCVRKNKVTHYELNVLFEAMIRLEDQLKDKKEPFIGEVYHRELWKKFKKDDIDEHHLGHYKIKGKWYQYDKILFYDKLYDDLREGIENE